MTTQSPVWLDACYVQKVLQNADNDQSIKVSSISVKAATAKGDNYASDMHRVNVEFSRLQNDHEIQEKKCLIVKAVPDNEVREKMTESMGIFKTEMRMMSVTLPKMNAILKNSSSSSLHAQCFHVQYEKPTNLVIEDLAPRGFRMADRQAGLDLQHCLLAIKNLGRFHAASIVLKEKDSESFSLYVRGMLHEDQPVSMTEYFESSAKQLANEASQWNELSPRISEKLVQLSEGFFKKGCEAARFKENDFNVLNHGDFWVNNMLFRYDDQQKPIDHIFVDFQISHYGSPAVDILYFFGTSPADDVRLHHRELILREYHNSLSRTMAELKSNTEVPSFEKLEKSLKERAFLELVAAVTVLPFVVLDKGDEINIEDLMKETSYVNPGYRGKTFRKIMTRILPMYDNLGLLDV